MTEAVLAPIIAGSVFGSSMMIASLLWPVKRPWDVVYRILFAFFGIFIMTGTMGIANDLVANYPLNAGSSPAVACPSTSSCVAVYYNSTGNLMAANYTIGGLTWTPHNVTALDGVPASSKNISLTNLTNVVWFLWVFTAVWFVLFVVEIGMWWVDTIRSKRDKRSGADLVRRGGDG